jgi:teichuronic acid biosynthesis glycosyltransferase TuaC
MRILAVTNMYPTRLVPDRGTYVQTQIEGLKKIGLEIDVLFVNRLQKGMGVYFGLRRHLRAMVDCLQPHVIHTMYGGVMADVVTRAVTDRPTVVTFHGSDLLGERLSGFVRNSLAGYGVSASWKAARRASGIVVVSKQLQDALPKDIDRCKIKIIPCGIDLGTFKPLDRQACRDRLGWSTDRFHVLFPASPTNAVKRPELARAAVEAAKHLGIPAEMHYLNGMPNTQVPISINASDVVLLTSFHEGSPTIVKEALACNIPVVSVNVGDVREQIRGINGCYLARAEPGDLAAKLHKVYRCAHRIASSEKVQELSLECIASRLKQFYEELISAASNNQKFCKSQLLPAER